MIKIGGLGGFEDDDAEDILSFSAFAFPKQNVHTS
jgi:hypothetical protein